MNSGARKIFISDCEGPITKNDNAAEIAEAFLPSGDRFFKTISLYDDYLAEVVRRPNYKAGDTLRLILPFFKAFGLDNRTLIKFSRLNIDVIPQAQHMLRKILEIMPAYIVSTSYVHYIRAVCAAIEFPVGNTFSTELDLDVYSIDETEKNEMRQIHKRILELPEFTVPSGVSSVEDLPKRDVKTLLELDQIFWEILPGMRIGKIIEDVNPIGGREKARAIRDILQTENGDLQDVFYVGDSITDVEAFRIVKNGGGMALSFNGNDWAVKEASFAITAQNAFPIGWLAELFLNQGQAGFQDLTMSVLNPETVETISRLSCRVRKNVRTEKIGGLG